MIKFKKLKVKGFKSFVEPTEVIIEQGLTGIVGPNGCGKSNLVEGNKNIKEFRQIIDKILSE